MNNSTTGASHRKDDVIRAALAVFGAQGYNNGSLADVAEHAGMTRAGVLHHFGSKAGLLMAMLAYRDGTSLEGTPLQDLPDGQVFLDHVLLTVKENVERPGVVQAYTLLSSESVAADHPAHEFFRTRITGLRDKLERSLLQVAAPGTTQETARDGASALIAIMDGLQVQWLLDPAAVDMPRILAKAIRDTVKGLAAGTPEPAPAPR